MSARASDGERFRAARREFEELVDLPPGELSARLATLAASDPGLASAVRELLAADERARGFLSSPGEYFRPRDQARESGGEEDPGVDLRGETVGAYRLIEPLGRGGMGDVYLGERADGRFEQKVAVKLVKRGMDTAEILRRFARERRILARLDHPGIARLLDGGETSDGRPYFVMELVDGVAITEHCRARGLALEERLRLVAECCDAADAAHRSLVVHRDLKPSNILVTLGGRVKLLDFGIAKLLDEDDGEPRLTRQGVRALTPAYAAPEQILGGPVTVATDVFAIGVVLYELLTGTLPFDRSAESPHGLPSRIERESAERPSILAARQSEQGDADRERGRWVRRLRGDLDTIVLKAMAREPERRYLSAAALAEDLRRFLESRPVLARPESRSYRLRKFLVRHRVGAGAASLGAAAVLAALAVSLVQTSSARREAERAAAAQAFLTGLFDRMDPGGSADKAPTVRSLIERGSERLDEDLANQPELRAEMNVLLGRVFDQLALPDQGERHWRRAVETREELFGPGDPRTGKAKRGLAISLARQARYDEAEPYFAQALEAAEAAGDERELAGLLSSYGLHKIMSGSYAEAQTLLERSVALFESDPAPDAIGFEKALNVLGLAHWRQGRKRQAAEIIGRALELGRENHGPGSGALVNSLHNLAQLHHMLNDLDAAERFGREALTIEEAVFPPGHPQIAQTLEALGQVAQKRGDRAEARALYERSIAIFEASRRSDHPDIAYSLRLLGEVALADGQREEALRYHERALAVRRRALGDRHPDVAESWHDLASSRGATGDSAGALEALRIGVSIYRDALPADSPRLASALFLLGDALRRNGLAADALPLLEEAHSIWTKAPPTQPSDLADLESAIAATRASLL